MPAYEYARVPWEQVESLAAQGWRLMQIPPVPEMKAMLGQVQMTGVVLYHLERELAAGTAGNGAEVGVTRPEPSLPLLIQPSSSGRRP